MSTDLTVVDNVDELEQMLEQKAKEKSLVGIPRLSINRTPESDDGKTLPMGHYTVTLQDPETRDIFQLFAKEVTFQPLKYQMQYSVWDEVEQKISAKSIFFSSFFGTEIKDNIGGMKCGKFTRKEKETLEKAGNWTKEMNDVQEAAKCAQHLWGFLTMDGVDADGVKRSVVNVPVEIKAGGANYMGISDRMNELEKTSTPIFRHPWSLTNHSEKNGSNVYYVIDAVIDRKTQLKLPENAVDVFRMFEEAIETNNKTVLASWDAVHMVTAQDESDAKTVKDMLNAPLGSDLGDDFGDTEVPF